MSRTYVIRAVHPTLVKASQRDKTRHTHQCKSTTSRILNRPLGRRRHRTRGGGGSCAHTGCADTIYK
eukprot:4170804-Prymnesium_polylepis.1